jgi:hypothetical protein
MQQKKVVIVQPTSNGRFTIIPQPEDQQQGETRTCKVTYAYLFSISWYSHRVMR